MLKFRCRQSSFLLRELNQRSFRRFFLSSSYKCTEAWEKRLRNPVFQKIDLGNVYYHLDLKFQSKKSVNVLDIDFFVNSIKSQNYKNELEDVLVNLRGTPETAALPERTSHAVIRWYIDNAPKEDLLNILSDRLTFGIFPDYFLTNLLMDKYLIEGDPLSATKVAVLQMLQEDFDHAITKALALHSCYKYLESPDVWESLKEPEPDPEEEVQKVRVEFLRNYYYDDHFDITDTNHLVGKTLTMLGEVIGGPLGVSSQLLGLVLHEKYDKCVDLLEKIIANNMKIYEEAVIKAKEFTTNKPKQIIETTEVKDPDSSKSETEKTDSDVKDKTSSEEKLSETQLKVLQLLGKVDTNNLIKGSLISETENLVKNAVKEQEQLDIENQCKLYNQWEIDREEDMKKEIQKKELEKLQSEITKTKEELKAEEEKLFFFERQEKIAMVVDEKEKEMKSVVYFKPKRKTKDKENVEDAYIPPDVTSKTKQN